MFARREHREVWPRNIVEKIFVEVPQNAVETDYREAFFPKAENVVGDERDVTHMIQVNVRKNNPFQGGLFGR